MIRSLSSALLLVAVACSFRDISGGQVADNGGSSGVGTGGNTAGGGGASAAGGSGASAGASAAAGASGSAGSPPLAPCTGCGTNDCVCAPKAPLGWFHAAFVEGESASSCPGGFNDPLVRGKDPVDTGCEPCACVPVPGVDRCHPLDYTDSSCGTTLSGAGTLDQSGSCVPSGGGSAKSMNVVPQKGCAINVNRIPPTFGTQVTMCRAEQTATTCEAGFECVPRPPSPFNAKPCVMSATDGNQSCPSGYSVQSTAFGSITDKRSCTGCACDATGCSGGSIVYCTGSGCTGCSSAKPIDSCHSGSWSSYKVTSPASPPGCKASGTPKTTGSVQGAEPRVICCTP